MHEELCLYPQEDSLTSYICYMMPEELSDGNARIDSNLDTVHARGALSVYPQEDSLTSYICYMMPEELSDRNARIDSINPDTVHSRETGVKSCMPRS